MGLYVNQKCGSCKKSLTRGYVANYSGIGEPFVVCGRCGTTNNNSNRVTEWKLKSALGKSFFVLRHVLSVIIIYGFGGVCVGALIAAKGNMPRSDIVFVAVFGCILAYGLLSFLFRLGRAIGESNARMNNANYISKLRRMGLIR
ncbi:hypothetical protein [Paraburkholderia metrosideri]|uniref:Uncharacterized protein n=1 Tax=Paraburkholderia metrosideri TaxID=580937 RepID=A0ABM8NLN6_9BURK|nr:hypothetical protein [Paraburkholderia metrosideri]CAD6531845.1 hypothetical protein LMG28140_02550 [Paraburkholderia metrosideri]